MSDQIKKLEDCIAIARRAGNRFLEANLLKALKEAKKNGKTT